MGRMNESAVRLEEQIISLFPDRETLVCQGWILKKKGGQLFVHPLYCNLSQMNILDNIQKCEEISRQSSLDCTFRIIEHTNYHLSSVLTDNGYKVEKCCVVGRLYLMGTDRYLCDKKAQKCRLFLKETAGMGMVEYVMAESGTRVGIKRQSLLFLPDGNLSDGVGLGEILQFVVENGITQVLADFPGREKLPEQYMQAGFSEAYLYRCYQKQEENSSRNQGGKFRQKSGGMENGFTE